VGNGGHEMRVPRPTLLAPIRGAGSPGRVCVCLDPNLPEVQRAIHVRPDTIPGVSPAGPRGVGSP